MSLRALPSTRINPAKQSGASVKSLNVIASAAKQSSLSQIFKVIASSAKQSSLSQTNYLEIATHLTALAMTQSEIAKWIDGAPPIALAMTLNQRFLKTIIVNDGNDLLPERKQ
jgi:hypothetical protein